MQDIASGPHGNMDEWRDVRLSTDSALWRADMPPAELLPTGLFGPKRFQSDTPMSKLLCLKNILVFLSTCKTVFEIRERNLLIHTICLI